MYWYNKVRNFGDLLSPILCSKLSGQRTMLCNNFYRCQLVAIGSILRHIKPAHQYQGCIWGSGLIKEKQPAEKLQLPHAKIHALRGKLTKQALGCTDDIPLGDPGLLCDLFARPVRKQYKLGFIPHFADFNLPWLEPLIAKCPDITLINVKDGMQPVLDAICQCEAVAGSAMHPLIAADSLGIPNVWLKLSDRMQGGDFKFHDYYSAFGIQDAQPVYINQDDSIDSLLEKISSPIAAYSRPGLQNIKHRLMDSFPFPLSQTSLFTRFLDLLPRPAA